MSESELGRAQQAAQSTTHHEGYPDGSGSRRVDPAQPPAADQRSEQVAPTARTRWSST